MKRFFTMIIVVLCAAITLGGTQSANAEGLSATLSSVQPAVVCSTNTQAVLTVNIIGEPPYLIEYTDGEYIYSTTVETNTAYIWVSPYFTTTYSLIGVYDWYENSGEVAGSVTLTVTDSPVITSNLDTQTLYVCPGASAVLSIAAEGGSIRYQWLKDGYPIEGNESATSSTLVINNFAASDIAAYSCDVYSDCSESPLTSNARMIDIAQGMQLVGDLSGGTMEICRGAMVELQVIVEGSGLQYQWRRNGIPLQQGESSFGNTFMIESAQDTDAGIYDCVVSSWCSSGSIISNTTTLLLNVPIAIVNQPVGQTVCAGSDVTISVDTYGSSPTFQWYKDGEKVYNEQELQGHQLVLHNVSAQDAGEYHVRIGSTCTEGTLVSDVAIVNVYRTLSIDLQPQDQSTCKGSSVQLHVDVDGQYPSYQWTHNGEIIANNASATTPTLMLSDVNIEMSGEYSVDITDVCGQLSSNTIELSVFEPVSIQTQPQSMTVCSGVNLYADVNARGSVGRYQWTKDGQVLPNQTSYQLNLQAVTPLESGRYRCEIFGAAECEPHSATTDEFYITVYTATRIITQPKTTFAANGGSAVFFVQTEGTGNVDDQHISYQWYEGHTMLIDDDRIQGSTSSQLTLKTVSSLDEKHYFVCAVHGACGDVVSDGALLVIPPVSILEQPQSAHVCGGSTVTLNVRAVSTPDISIRYQWYKGTKRLDGETEATLTLNRLSAADNGLYYVQMLIADKVTVNSATASILALEAPGFGMGIPLQQKSVCPGSYLELKAVTVSGNELRYQWYVNGTVIEGAEGQTYVDYGVTTAYAGVYSVRVTNGCSSAFRNIVNVQLVPKTEITVQPAAQTIVKAGQTLRLSVQASGYMNQYQWLFNNVVIPSAVNAEYVTTATKNDAGLYSVRVFGSCGTVTSEFALVLVNEVSAVETSENAVAWNIGTCQPNPASDVLRIPISIPMNAHIRVQLFDAAGQLVTTLRNEDVEAGLLNVQCDVAALNLASGAYTVSLLSDTGIYRQSAILVLR